MDAQAGTRATTRKLADYTLEEQNDRELMTYAQLCALRREAYRAHVAQLHAPELTAAAARLAEVYGPAAKAHHNAVPWDVAFLIGRYGEAIEHWPTSLTTEDLARLAQWEEGAHEFSTGVKALGTTIYHDPAAGHLFGLEEFGDAITVTRPAPATPAAATSDATTEPAS